METSDAEAFKIRFLELCEKRHSITAYKLTAAQGVSIMKIHVCHAMLVLFMFAGVSLAQVPAPVLIVSTSNELSGDFLVTAKGPTPGNDKSVPWSFGRGGQFAGAHFFRKYIGAKLQADYERMDYDNQTEAGVRVGPVLRLATFRAVQPYVEALVGYARVRASYLRPVSSYHSSGSVLGGGGVDFPLPGSGRWYARAGVEIQDDWTAKTSVGHGFLGISYRFNGATRSPK